MGPHLARRGPHHQDKSISHGLGRQNGLIVRVEPVAVAADPFLRGLDLLGGQTGRRQDRPVGPLLDADDDVAAVQVVMVIGERTDRLERLALSCAGPTML